LKHWNDLRFGSSYSGLDSKGLDTEPVAIIIARSIYAYNKIMEYDDYMKLNNITSTPNHIKRQLANIFSQLDNSHYQMISEIYEKFLPSLMIQNVNTNIQLLGMALVVCLPLLFIFWFFLMRILNEYEDDNYEFLQQFQRVPPEVVTSNSAIKKYIFDSSLAEVDNFSLMKIFKCKFCCKFPKLFRLKKQGSGSISSLSANEDEACSKLAEDIYQSCPTPVVVCSQNGNISFINDSAMKIFEFESQSEVIGIAVTKLFAINSKMMLSGFFKSLVQQQAGGKTPKDTFIKEEHVFGLRKATLKEFPCILTICCNMVRGHLSIPFFVTDITTQLQHEALIQEEKSKSEKLLLSILPAAVAKKLGEGEQLIVESFPDVTCFFSDICGFTNMSSKITAWELIKLFVYLIINCLL